MVGRKKSFSKIHTLWQCQNKMFNQKFTTKKNVKKFRKNIQFYFFKKCLVFFLLLLFSFSCRDVGSVCLSIVSFSFFLSFFFKILKMLFFNAEVPFCFFSTCMTHKNSLYNCCLHMYIYLFYYFFLVSQSRRLFSINFFFFFGLMRPRFNHRLSHTKDSKNGTWYLLA